MDANGIFIGLGSNLGDRLAHLQAAKEALSGNGIVYEAVSSVYETPPWGLRDQPAFLNAVIRVAFAASPMNLLRELLAIEERMGRTREAHWGPRVIDLDILAFGQQRIVSQRLTIPHPMLQVRAFVLLPWAEIAPDFPVGEDGTTVTMFLDALDPNEVKAIHKIAEGFH